MSTPQRKVSVVDYGAGNLLSVLRAFKHVGAEAVMIDSPEAVKNAGHLVLPGVGAFAKGMEELKNRDLVPSLLEHANSGKPFLGICLGMQMMMETSKEFGHHAGLGFFAGNVVKIPETMPNGTPHKIPHVGWSGLQTVDGASWEGTALDDVAPGSGMYFVHSYCVVPRDPGHQLAVIDYNGRVISAAIYKDNLHGFQAHPEKSGKLGLQILQNFLAFD